MSSSSSSPTLAERVLVTSHPSIAQRVNHLYIRPGFLPGMGESDPPPPSLRQDNRGILSLLRSRFRLLCSYPSRSVQTNKRIVILAQAAIRRCRNVRELTIVLHDFFIPRSFALFLESSWACLAGNIRKLTISVTLTKLSLLLGQGESYGLAVLEELEIYIVYSRFPFYNGQTLVKDRLLPFTISHRETLRALTISSSIPLDWSPYLDGLGHFPLLQKLVLILTISYVTLSNPSALTRVLDTHQENLRHFKVIKNHGYSLNNPRDSLYGAWVTDEFSTLILPVLQTLEIGLWPDLPWRSPPSLSIIPQASCLVSLTIFDVVLCDTQVDRVLDSLQLGPDGGLQELRLSVVYLHPQLMDLLAAKLPLLKVLDLTFDRLAPNTDIQSAYYNKYAYVSFTFVSYVPCQTILFVQTLFEREMNTRMYTDWELQYLKLSLASSNCGKGHSQLGCMSIVARCIPRGVVFGLENDCFCNYPRVLGPDDSSFGISW